MDNLEFEKHYKNKGFASQRRYPNEALIGFLVGNYFHLSKEERKNTKILELGCGSGANLWMIAKEGFDAYGIDIAPTGIELCKEMLALWNTDAKVSVGNAQALDFGDNSFDAIVDVVTLQHIDLEGHRKAFKEAYRCLKTGGKFFSWHLGARSISFLSSWGNKIDKSTVDDIKNPEAPLYIEDGHVGITNFLTPTDVKEELSKAGFKDISVEVFDRTYRGGTQHLEYLSITASKK